MQAFYIGLGPSGFWLVESPELNVFHECSEPRQGSLPVFLWLVPEPGSATMGYGGGWSLVTSNQAVCRVTCQLRIPSPPPKSLSVTGSGLAFVPGLVPGTFPQAASTRFTYLPHVCWMEELPDKADLLSESTTTGGNLEHPAVGRPLRHHRDSLSSVGEDDLLTVGFMEPGLMTCSRILPLLAVSLLSYEYPPSAFCMCPVANLAPGAWCLASTPSPPYPESHGAHVCGVWRRGEQRWKMLSLEVQVNEPLTSPPGQSKGQPSALHEVCLRQLSHLRDMVPPGPRRLPSQALRATW